MTSIGYRSIYMEQQEDTSNSDGNMLFGNWRQNAFRVFYRVC